MRKFFSALLTALFLWSAAPVQAEENFPDPRRVFRWDRDERLLGFKSVEKITPTHTVEAGGEVRPLTPAMSEKGRKLASMLEKITDKFMQSGIIVGLMVVSRGEILAERYAHGFTPQDRWTSFSVAKSITATLAGAALADGSIKSLDDPVTDYVPELKGTAYDGVTIKHLLTMTSGVQWNEDYSDPDSDTARLALGAGEKGHDPLADLAVMPRVAEPGTQFDYKTGETNLLGLVVSRATGMNLAQYLSQKIWRPAGMETEAYWAVDGLGRELAGCCLSMTLRDYARFGLFILEDGRAADRAVLPEGWLATSAADVTGQGYGYHWWVLDDDIFAANGIFGQLIAIDPSTQSVAVILSAWDKPLSRDDDNRRFNYLFSLRALATAVEEAR